tara:strand:- start:1249 stop:2727 length:1479 start_codon:yes stop_codon:yes gene_type:complete
MADQGLLAQSKPAGTTNTLLYAAPTGVSASTVLTIANDGTGAAYDVGIKDYDQKLVLDNSTYKLHEGDIITAYRFNLGTTPIANDAGLTPGTTLTSTDGEKSAIFESFFTPAFTEIDVKKVSITAITLDTSPTPTALSTFPAGATISNGSGGAATIYDALDQSGTIILYVNVTAGSFSDGDSLTTSASGTGTIAASGVGTAADEFVFATGGSSTYNLTLVTPLTVFADRAYRFDISDSSMSGTAFALSDVVNGIHGPGGDGTSAGTEYTTGKTTNGTAGSGGAYIQYDFTQDAALVSQLYFFENSGAGTSPANTFGGSDRFINTSTSYTYDEIYVYDLTGTWVGGSDTFLYNGVTYNVASLTAGPYGTVRAYTGTSLSVIKGVNSADFAGSDTFQDVPLLGGAARATATVNSVSVATTALEDSNYIAKDVTNAANNVDRITSLVVGPGERVIVESATQNNIFSLIGFEDTSTALTLRTYSTQEGGGAASGSG